MSRLEDIRPAGSSHRHWIDVDAPLPPPEPAPEEPPLSTEERLAALEEWRAEQERRHAYEDTIAMEQSER